MSSSELTMSLLNSAEVDQLLVLCEEVNSCNSRKCPSFYRTSAGRAFTGEVQATQYDIWETWVRKIQPPKKDSGRPDNRPTSHCLCRYADVQGSFLSRRSYQRFDKEFHEFKAWLGGAATTPATKTSFWKKLFGTTPNRPAFNKAKTGALTTILDGLIKDLDEQLRAPELAEKHVKQTYGGEETAGVELTTALGVPGTSVKGKANLGSKSTGAIETQSMYVSHKVEYLHQNILRFQKFFQELSVLSDGPSFLILDDLYYIRRSDQAKVIDYFHRIAKGNGMWLKVGTIKHRSDWYRHTDPPIGLKLGDDAKEINLTCLWRSSRLCGSF